MPDTVIARVNELGRDQPETLTFADRHGRPIGDAQIPGVTSNCDDPDDTDPAPVDTNDETIEITGVDGDQNHEIAQDGADLAPINDDDIEIADDPDAFIDPPLIDDAVDAPFPTQNETPDIDLPPDAPVQQLRRSTRATFKPKSYIPSMQGSKHSHAVTQLERGLLHPDAHMFAQEDFHQTEPDVVAIIMTQLSLKAGIERWGERGIKAATSEMKQLHLRDTFKPVHWKSLSPLQRLTVLESHMFLKEKRSGLIEGRTVAGGNKQRDCISKEDVSSPTVATQSVLLTSIIRGKGCRCC